MNNAFRSAYLGSLVERERERELLAGRTLGAKMALTSKVIRRTFLGWGEEKTQFLCVVLVHCMSSISTSMC